MTALRTEARRTVPVFQAILAICRTASERDVVLPVAEQLAHHAGARLELACAANETYTTLLDAELSDRTACRLIPRAHEHRADVVAMTPCVARGSGRRLLAAGTAVLVVPPLAPSRPRVLRIGIGYDGGRPADAALEIARALVAARPSPVTHMDVVYVDDTASGSCDAQEQVVSSRREAILEWWLEDVARQIPTPVRVSRPAGDAANELAQLSDELDLLVVGTRGQTPLRRALTGSVSTKLVATTRCPLLIVPSATTGGLMQATADEYRAA
jgi:nucleotide-binding universal stress UspA family protein